MGMGSNSTSSSPSASETPARQQDRRERNQQKASGHLARLLADLNANFHGKCIIEMDLRDGGICGVKVHRVEIVN